MPFEVHMHYNCQMSNVTTNTNMKTPTWHRVSQTPWDAKALKTSGYGRPILRCAISDDMPLYFPRTEHIKRPEDLKALPKQDCRGTASIQASLVLPGAESTLAPKPQHGNRIRKLIHTNQILAEPYPTPRDNATFFNWDAKTPRTGRVNTTRDNYRESARGASARPSTTGQNSTRESYRQRFPSSRIASARSTGRSRGGASNRAQLVTR